MRAVAFLTLLTAAGCARAKTRKAGPEPAATLEKALVPAAAPQIPEPPPPAPLPPPAPRRYAVVLHTGDSTVGGNHGLARALRARFEAEGAKYVSDTVNSASLLQSESVRHIAASIERHKPDLVLVNLGTNEVFVPVPQALVPRIRAIVRKIGARDCVWIGPPTWKGDRGLVAVLRDNVAPCRFFDSSNMQMERLRDGIHPTDKGGEQWGARFWGFFREETPALDALR